MSKVFQTDALKDYQDFAISAKKADQNAKKAYFDLFDAERVIDSSSKKEPVLRLEGAAYGGFSGRDVMEYTTRETKSEIARTNAARQHWHTGAHAQWEIEHEKIKVQAEKKRNELLVAQTYADSFKDELAKKLEAVLALGVSDSEIAEVQDEIELAGHRHHYYRLLKDYDSNKNKTHEELLAESDKMAVGRLNDEKRYAREAAEYKAKAEKKSQKSRSRGFARGFNRGSSRAPASRAPASSVSSAPALAPAPVVRVPMCSAGCKCCDAECKNSHPTGYSLKLALEQAKFHEEIAAKKAAREAAAKAQASQP